MSRSTVDFTGDVIKIPKKLLREEPTHVSRYWIISQMISSISKGDNVNVLDVGGKKGLLRSFGLRPTVIDIEEGNEPNYVKGNALNMPFSDDQFDIAVSCDVLEHIVPADRAKFIDEMLRVSNVAIICAPFDHDDVVSAELKINNRYKELFKSRHRWLGEHIENGLPSEDEIGKIINSLGYKYAKIRHFSTDVWISIMEIHFLHAAMGDDKDIVDSAETTYTSYYHDLCKYDFSEKGYRTFFVIAKEKPELKLYSSNRSAEKRGKYLAALNITMFDIAVGQAKKIRQATNKASQLKSQLTDNKNTIQRLQEELHDIKSSKKWKLAQTAANIKSVGRR